MNSIESLKIDFSSEFSELNKIQNEKFFDECIFVGSGDSFIAGLVAEYLTDHKCRCYSPSDLFNSRFSINRTYCFVSVTGKTKANIKVAERATQIGARTIAITLDKNSKLAQACKEVVPLKVTRTQTPTAGFSTFTANVITCLQLAGIKVPQKFDVWHKNGAKLSVDFLKSIVLPKKDSIYLLGNNLLYAVCLYSSFQMAEFFGSNVRAHKLEEFCHSPIFGLRNSDYVWILGQNESQLREKLNPLGPQFSYIELYNRDIFAQVFQSIFFVQNLMLLLAQRHGLTELQYVLMKDILKTSSDIIY